MNIALCVCVCVCARARACVRTLVTHGLGSCKLHAVLSVDVLYTRILSDSFNGSEHPMKHTLVM